MAQAHRSIFVIVCATLLLQVSIFTPAQGQGLTDTGEPATDLFTIAAIDLFNLEECIPMRIEDGYVLSQPIWDDAVTPEKRLIHAQTCLQYGSGDCDNWWQGKIKLSAPVPDDWQGTIGMRFRRNDYDRTGDGDTFVEVRKQLHNDVGRSASLYGITLTFPTGRDYARVDETFPPFSFRVNERSNNIDLTLLGVYTMVLDTQSRERIHGEVQHTFASSAPPGFHSNRWFLGFGYDRQISDNIIGLGSLWWEQAPSSMTGASSALQLGLRKMESPRFLWGASFNLGLGWEDANWGFAVAADYGF